MSGPGVKNIPLLVVSCDRYADLWRPFFYVFRKRWPDCPFPFYLGTNHLICREPNVKTITVGDDINWATGVQNMLEQIDSTHVVFFLEDFFLTGRVDTPAVERLVAIALEKKPACLRLAPLPYPTPLPKETIQGYPDIGIVEPDLPYRVSAQPAIWRTDSLIKLLVPGFNIWEFEHLGTLMSKEMPEEFLGPLKPYIIYDHALEKGKWKPAGLRICREAGIEPDLTARLAFTPEEFLRYNAAGEAAEKFHQFKEAALSGFIKGDRLTGTIYVFRCLARRPFFLQSWAILLFGMIGPGALKWLRRVYLKHKIDRIRFSKARRT